MRTGDPVAPATGTAPPAETDVVIVGGGLAGLAAARRLHRAGTPWVLVEAADRLGGRVATDRVDGYLLDRGFQVVNTAYPRQAALLDPDDLELGLLTHGVLVRRGAGLHRMVHPLRDPLGAARTVLTGLADAAQLGRIGQAPGAVGALARTAGAERISSVGYAFDRLRLAGYAARCATYPVERLLAVPELTTELELRRVGLSDRGMEELLRPFLSGVFGERELTTSSHVLAMVVRAFARGRIGLPAAGMAALPAALAATLPTPLITLGVPVTSVRSGLVTTAAGPIRCRAVLVAVDPGTANRLLPGLPPVRMNGLTTYYHSTAQPPLDEPVLLLDGDRGGLVANTVVPSLAAPTYAPAGRHLVATSVAGPPAPPEPAVRAELARLYGVPVDDWEHLTTVAVPAALPATPPPRRRLRAPVVLGDGLFVAGDHRASPSAQGALASGWRAAGAILRRLRGAGSVAAGYS
ncbi:FAD-dependent oxidoreductase [Plantactinospora sp. B5E13]|uniref:FAD-dependent oxidoreductase n=1 Tax=Plantactinospora sp. B5E13 TaxID=3153758 RepID=UPI00325C81D8